MTASVIVLALALGAMALIALIVFANHQRSPTPNGRPTTSGSDGYVPWMGGDSSSSDCGAGDAGGCGDGGGGGGGD